MKPDRVETLPEWCPETALHGLGDPTDADLELAARLTKQRDLEIDWLVGGTLRVRTRSCVGVVRFDALELRIEPKLVGGDLGVLQMIEYATGIEALRWRSTTQAIDTTGKSLIDLICQLLVAEAMELVDAGLLSDYVERDERLPYWRGRLRTLEHASRLGTRVDVLECHYEDLETDIPENRLVAAGLDAARRWCRSPAIRRDVARTASAFEAACENPLGRSPDDHDIVYNRRNRHYQAAHFWSKLLIRQTALEKLFADNDTNTRAFLIDMNSLYELFVSKLLEDALRHTGLHVHRQRRDASILFDVDKGGSFGSVRPDLLVERTASGEFFPIDAKYKLYDERRLDVSDVYQLFLYAQAYKGWPAGSPQALIVYPATVEAAGRLGFRMQVRDGAGNVTARIEGVPIDVPAVLAGLRDGSHVAQMASVVARLTATGGLS